MSHLAAVLGTRIEALAEEANQRIACSRTCVRAQEAHSRAGIVREAHSSARVLLGIQRNLERCRLRCEWRRSALNRLRNRVEACVHRGAAEATLVVRSVSETNTADHNLCSAVLRPTLWIEARHGLRYAVQERHSARRKLLPIRCDLEVRRLRLNLTTGHQPQVVDAVLVCSRLASSSSYTKAPRRLRGPCTDHQILHKHNTIDMHMQATRLVRDSRGHKALGTEDVACYVPSQE